MAECKKCLYFDICKMYADDVRGDYEDNCMFEDCLNFKNKVDFVEVETIKDWLYEMAINNVGCVLDGDFSNACEEIISRLDGLRSFARERTPKERGVTVV